MVLPEFPESASETAQKPFLVVPGNFWSGKGKRATDGARTRDVLDHNQVLYQLSYGRRRMPEGTRVPLVRSTLDPERIAIR